MPEQSLGFFGTIFRGMGKAVSFIFIEKFGRNTMIIIMVLVFFLYAPVKTAVNEKSPKIVVDVIMSKLVSADNGINFEVENIKNKKDSGFLDVLKSLLKILTLLYIFWFVGTIFYKIGNAQNDTSKGRNTIIAVIGIILLQVIGSLYILFAEHHGSLKEDVKYVVGGKSFLSLISFLNPVKGIWNFGANIGIFIEPFSKSFKRLYGD